MTSPQSVRTMHDDVLIVGAGAAGLATAIFAARAAPRLRVRCLDGARHIGAKILVSGGSRCNVTNREVSERDFWGGSARVVRRVLRAFPAERAAAFFEGLGVALHEEEDGKLFPDSGRSRTVLEALLAEAARVGVGIEREARVTAIRRNATHFVVSVESQPDREATRVVLATGGRSLPKTGSDGLGYELAARLGHGHVATTPALAPLVLGSGPHRQLSGVTHRVALTLHDGDAPVSLAGSLLWTHFGFSCPVALNLSRHWHRSRLRSADLRVALDLTAGETFEHFEAWLLQQQVLRPRARVETVVAARLPAAVATQWIAQTPIDPAGTVAHLTREDRRALMRALRETTLDVRDSRGYVFAEATAGGIPLDEVDPSTLESRVCPGLYLTGEMLDVDGRLGGFNFQWAWSCGWVAGQALARASDPARDAQD
jgi:predicted Rossmann fold flavoprotein